MDLIDVGAMSHFATINKRLVWIGFVGCGLMLTSATFAMPVASSVSSDSNCQTAFQRKLNGLGAVVEKASVMIAPGDDPNHPDGRGSVVTLGPQLGLSPEEIDQIRKSTGYIVCSGTKE